MAVIFSGSGPSSHLHPLLLLLLHLFLCVASSSDLPLPSLPVPDWRSAQLQPLTQQQRGDMAEDYHPRPKPKPRADNNNVMPRAPPPDTRRYSERLDLDLVQSATTWLHVRWHLRNETGGVSVVVPRSSRVTCHAGNTTLLERHITGPGTQLRIPNLSSNTRYLVCVETVETMETAAEDEEEGENYLHYRCAPFRTIPLVRPDSVLGLLLTLGYIFLMGMMGYVTWCLRMRRYTSAHKAAAGNEVELSCRTSTVPCSEIEERVHLNSHAAPANSKLYSGQL